jgi:hypothetical protein
MRAGNQVLASRGDIKLGDEEVGRHIALLLNTTEEQRVTVIFIIQYSKECD